MDEVEGSSRQNVRPTGFDLGGGSSRQKDIPTVSKLGGAQGNSNRTGKGRGREGYIAKVR
jgi:hypothetical protein